jgi:glycosyltransferase involved in cell wall biosynthesis
VRVAIIHYWIVTWRGGEKVLKAMADAYPQADIFTHVYDPELVNRELPARKVASTFIGKLPFAMTQYQKYLPLMPLALEQLDLREYDLVISNESGPAKGVIVGPHTPHLCYCLSPMRYLWDMYPDYLAGAGLATRFVMRPGMHYLRMWDQLSAQRVDRYLAISRFISTRIAKYYRRKADVIYPPVATGDLSVSFVCEDFYLSVGQLVAYKRADLLVEAFNRMGKRLVIIGEGQLEKKLKGLAKPNIQFLGKQPFDVIRDHYARCKALVFPGMEDFGIVPVEAMASGKPVIALGAGGALDTVIDGKTGILYAKQSAQALIDAVTRFESLEENFQPEFIRAHAEQFSTERFTKEFKTAVDQLMIGNQSTDPSKLEGDRDMSEME